MISEPLADVGAELEARMEPFVTATVVRVQHPTGVNAGATAVIHADGTLEGFIGGVCAQHSVRLYALKAIESGEPILLRIMPDPEHDDADSAPVDAATEIAREEGSVTVRNPCLSGGTIEVFLQPTLPPPRVNRRSWTRSDGSGRGSGSTSSCRPVAGTRWSRRRVISR